MYSLDYSVKSFAIANQFSATMNKICFKLGKGLKPFSLLGTALQAENGVVDLTQFGGMLDESITLLDDIIKYRHDTFGLSPVPLKDLTYNMKKSLLIDFLMSTSLCYVEVPKMKISQGMEIPTFEKFLCTRNPAVMGAWMGMSPDEMRAKYSKRISFDKAEFMNDIIRYVRLNTSSKGNSISAPRKYMETTDMRCVPLFMIYAWISGLRTVLLDNIVKIRFLKDNGSEREIYTTLSEDIVRSFYSNNEFVGKMLSSIDYDKSQQGGMYLPSQIGRGYMQTPELGASMYDASGVRAINVTRILEVSIADAKDVDTSYINVSLDSVKNVFIMHLDRIAQEEPQRLAEIYESFNGQKADSSYTTMELRVAMEKSVNSADTLFSTNFRRNLHKFMLGNPQWFKGYTGLPEYQNTNPVGCGVVDYDF